MIQRLKSGLSKKGKIPYDRVYREVLNSRYCETQDCAQKVEFKDVKGRKTSNYVSTRRRS